MAGPKVYFLQSFRLPSLPCCGEGCAGGGGGCGYGAVFVMSVCLFEVLYTVFSFHFISRLWRRHHPHDANFSTTRIVAAGVRKIWKVHSGWKIRPEKKERIRLENRKKTKMKRDDADAEHGMHAWGLVIMSRPVIATFTYADITKTDFRLLPSSAVCCIKVLQLVTI